MGYCSTPRPTTLPLPSKRSDAAVILRAELDARDVAEARVAAVGVRAQNDVGELVRGRRAA